MRLTISRPASLLMWVILLPALLLGLGLWESSRAHRSVDLYTVLEQELPRKVAELRALAVQDPSAGIDLGDGLLAPSLAADRLDEMSGTIWRDLMLARAQVVLASAVAIGAALALCIGAAGLIAASVAARQAKRSRDALVTSFQWLHRALPLLLGGMIIGLALATVGASTFEAISLWLSTALSGNSLKLMVLALALAGAAVWAAFSAVRGLREVFALYTPEPGDVNGRPVADAEAPALWRFVRSVAERQGTVAPDTVVVGLEQGFFVTEQDLRLWPGKQRVAGRTLYLPAPYLELLDQDEIEAIIGHELAHFSGEDTRYSRRFAPLYAGMQRALGAMEATGGGVLLLHAPLRMAGHTMVKFDESVQQWSRLREFEADRLGCVVAAPASAASALIRTAVIAPRVTAVLNAAFNDPEESATDLVDATARLVAEEGWPDVRGHLEDVPSHPTDTHPSTPDRIRKLGVAMDDALLATALRPVAQHASIGRQLIAGWEGLCRRLTDDFLVEARSAQEAHRLHLEAAVAAVPAEDVPLYENVAMMAHVQTVIGVACGVAALILFFGRDAFGLSDSLPLLVTFVGLFVAGAAFALFMAGRTRQRGKVPVMVLSPETLQAGQLRQPIRWEDIESWRVVLGKGLALHLILNEGVSLPQVVRYSRFTKVRPRKRQVEIGGYGVKGVKPAELADTVQRYIDADYARRALAG